MKTLSVFTVVLAAFFLLTGCVEEEESVLEDLFVEEETEEPVQEEVGPLPPHVIPADAPMVVIEEIPQKGKGRYGYRLRADRAPERDMVVQVREIKESDGRKIFEKIFSFTIDKGKTTSMDMVGFRVKGGTDDEEKRKLTATIIPLPNPFPELPLVFMKHDYIPPSEDDHILDLPDDYQFLLYNIGDPSRVEIEH